MAKKTTAKKTTAKKTTTKKATAAKKPAAKKAATKPAAKKPGVTVTTQSAAPSGTGGFVPPSTTSAAEGYGKATIVVNPPTTAVSVTEPRGEVVSRHFLRRRARAQEEFLEAAHPGNAYRVRKRGRGLYRYEVRRVDAE